MNATIALAPPLPIGLKNFFKCIGWYFIKLILKKPLYEVARRAFFLYNITMITPKAGIEKLMNVNKEEWPRIFLSWFISFFYRTSFVIAWTVIVGMFVGRYGISMLPVLFIVNGVFTMIGSFVFSSFIGKMSKENSILFAVFLSLIFLGVAALIGHSYDTLFFGLLIASEAVFLVQLQINKSGFVETLFTPLESERTFPVIESAETIGGIVAGLLVLSFSSLIDPVHFVYIWGFLLLMIVPCMMIYKKFTKGVYRFQLDEEHEHVHSGLLDRAKEVLSQARHTAFIKGLIFVVILQWIFSNLIEFQYTKAVTQNISAAVLTSGSGFEHALVHDLGQLFVLFSIAALLVQLFVGSRLITSLGVIGSMMVYPLVMLLSVFGMTVRFGYPTAVLARTNSQIAHAIYLNSYHSTYYSIKEHFREHVREFIEGIVRPIGAVVGTGILLSLQYFFRGPDLTLSINLAMIAVAIILFGVLYKLQSHYTNLASHNLTRSENKLDRIDAIGILSQKGHRNSVAVLSKVLHDPKESDFIKIKVLEALGELKDFDAIDDIVEMFGSKKLDIRLAAVNALLDYRFSHGFFDKNVFHEYKVIEALKALYRKEKNSEIRSLVVHILSKLNPVGTFGFLVNALGDSSGDLKADVVIALGSYKDEHIVPYIKPFLSSRKPMEKASALIALWNLHDYRDDTDHELGQMLKSSRNNVKCAAVYAVGELKLKKYYKYCHKLLHSDDDKVKAGAALALAKMGYSESVEVLVEFLFDTTSPIAAEIKHSLKKLPHKTEKTIQDEVRQIVSARINKMLKSLQTKSLNSLEIKSLKNLKMLYSLVDEHEEVELINGLLYSRSYS